MRVLVVTNMYPTAARPHYGIFVEEHVRSLRDVGIETRTFFTDTTRTRASYATSLPALARALRQTEWDVVHAQHMYSVFQVVLARRLARVRAPLMLTFHEGEAHLDPGEQDPDADALKKLVYSKALKRTALRLADHVVSVEERLPKLVGFDGPFEVIPPGVDIDLFRPIDRAEARSRLGLEVEGPLVLFPANPSRRLEKGAELFEQALHLVSPRPHVVYGGKIPRQDMPLYMNAADVVVQASRFEASPMVVKEAMACGRPIVSTDVGDVRWMFGDLPGHVVANRTAAELADAIRRGLSFDRPTGGRARIELLGLSLVRTAEKYRQAYLRSFRLAPQGKRKVMASHRESSGVVAG
jgi:glycosyltransferase involved in cell wall biosynthesis